MIEPESKIAPKTSRLVKIFKPNPTDGLLFVSMWLIFIAVLTALGSLSIGAVGINDVVWFPCAASVVACLAALATAIGWGQNSKWASWFLFILCSVVSFALGFLFSGLTPGLFVANSVDFGMSLSVIVTSILFAFFGAVLVLTLLLRWVPILAVRRIGLNRQKLMIGVAAVLLLLGVLQNAIYPNGEWLLHFQGSGFQAVFGTTLAFLFLIFVPGWAISTRKSWWVIVLTLLPVFGVVGSAISNAVWLNWNPFSMAAAVCTTIASILFVVTLMAIRRIKSAPGSNSNPPSRSIAAPSVWSFIIFSLLLSGTFGLFSFTKNYNLDALISPHISDSWEIARRSAQLSRDSNNQVRLIADGRSVGYECNFTETTRTDVLDVFDELDSGIFRLNRISPAIDTRFIREVPKQVHIVGGEITPQQLDDLANNCHSIMLENVRIVRAEPTAVLDSVAHVTIEAVEPGQIKDFFGSIKSFSQQSTIYISNQPSLEDWPAIVDASQNVRVFLRNGLSDEILSAEIDETKSMSGIWIYLGQSQLASSRIMRFILENDISISTSIYDCADDYNLIWDLLFAKRGEFDSNDSSLFFEIGTYPQGMSFKENMTRRHNAFGWNQSGQITELCIPGGGSEPGIEGLTELITLSLDPRWLVADYQFFGQTSFLPSIDLTKLTKLERLYFPMNGQFRSYEFGEDNLFQGALNRLKHMQIACESVATLSVHGFDKLTNLESLTLFGLPSGAVVGELSGLTKLKRLTLVDMSGTKTSSTWLAQVKKLLPGVTVVVVKASAWQPDLPQTFKDHVKKTKIEIKKRLLEELE